MHHLKKSYSLGDLSEGNQSQGSKHEDQRDGPYGYCGKNSINGISKDYSS